LSVLGLISDIHGDPQALEAALGRLRDAGASEVVCCGDVVGYGPDPDAAWRRLEASAIPTVRGNHDRWALERGPGVPDEFGGAPPSAETLRGLQDLPPFRVLERAGRMIVVVHGSPRSDMEFITPKTHPASVLEQMLKSLDADLIAHGHTHRPMWYRSKVGRLVLNPGSVVGPAARVESSRTCAWVDCARLEVGFLDLATGRSRRPPAWPGSASET